MMSNLEGLDDEKHHEAFYLLYEYLGDSAEEGKLRFNCRYTDFTILDENNILQYSISIDNLIREIYINVYSSDYNNIVSITYNDLDIYIQTNKEGLINKYWNSKLARKAYKYFLEDKDKERKNAADYYFNRCKDMLKNKN